MEGFYELSLEEELSYDGGSWASFFIGVASAAVGAAVGFAVGGPVGAAIGGKNGAAAGSLIGSGVGIAASAATDYIINKLIK